MYLGVDLGTSSVKLVLADESGKLIDSASASYPISYPEKSWSEQNPEDWWNGFCRATADLGARRDLSAIKAMSFSGQMHGLVILDENDAVIRPALLWNDGRTTAECAYLNDVIGKDKLLSLTGNIALTGFTAPKLLWLKAHEQENFARISKIMLPKDYIQYRLSGVFATDVSDASGTLFFDVKNRRWSAEMLDILGITEKQLPKVYESASVVGQVSGVVAKTLGFSSQTKLVIGGGDQAMGAIGTGTVVSGQVSISLGTSGVIFVASDEFFKQDGAELHSFCHANGKYHLMGVTLACAGSTKWWVEDVLKTRDYEAAFSGISDMPIDDLLFLPYLIGERSPINDPRAQGVFYGLSVMQNQKSLTKAVVEGVCFSLKDCLSAAKRVGVNPCFARAIGGGVKSSEWLQILSDVLNLEIRTINTGEGGALGAVILAMTATGSFESIDEACKALISDRDSYYPNCERAARYEEKFAEYKRLYNAVKPLEK